MSARHATPPPAAGPSRQLDLTPEQVRRLEENRLKAKAKLQDRERQIRQHAAQIGSDRPNALGKRPLQVIPADSTSPTAPNTRHVPSRPSTSALSASNALQSAVGGPSRGSPVKHFAGADGGGKDNSPLKPMIGQYVEYDLSTLKNSRGGFLLEGEEDDPKRLRERQLQEEMKIQRLENARKQGQLRGSAMALDPRENPKCVHCGTTDLDDQLRTVFGVMCCTPCKKERPEMYSLLTKTECKEDYLLTEPELKDTELMPHLLRPNPHRPTYSNMMLFLRCQVEEFAFSDKKWGSPEALDAEFERREAEKKEKKSKKFAKKLQELRKKTKTNVWHRRQEAEHQHAFVDVENSRGDKVQRCEECGFEVEVESF
ncbi:Hydrophilic protein [Rhodotorula toruloides ATCC 204091]|uniref:DNA repair protein RAD14 n=1 Tax=Rhodotorula toruloides TaxID=5286 RepID=A0A0K3CIR0_RHOTO|nr:Hydrophilic protein [Rhodotorula toruloides ATCC 204091]KAK4333345.1 DNA repair protein RAD14 [Rhodotorula toruloides]PRQ73223.1 hydrophilic protein [Rhodotorula toruloides]